MDDNQDTQQSSDGGLQIIHTRRRNNQHSSNFVMRVIQRSPWLIWLALWLTLMLVTGLSILSLTYIAGSGTRQARPLPPAIVETPVRVSSRNDSYIALWVLGAIVVCGTGYWVVFQQLQPSKPHRQKRLRRTRNRRQRLNVLKQVPQTNSMPVVESVSRVAPVTEPEEIVPIPTPVAPVAEPEEIVPKLEDNVESVPEQPEPLITILPPENNSPVDVENVSLAEMMDMRKYRSLSSILGENYDRKHEDTQTPRQVVDQDTDGNK